MKSFNRVYFFVLSVILLSCSEKKESASMDMSFDSTRVIKMVEPIKDLNERKEILLIYIDSLSQYSIEGEPVEDMKALKEKFLSKCDSANGMIAIQAHKDARIDALVKLMDAAKEYGLKAYLKTNKSIE